MSSCAASCSICCRPASCASATSDSSPTATALLFCRCACDCSADHRKTQPRRHHPPPIRPTHSGTAQSAAEPCASPNGSLLRNYCFARRRNQTGALHETLSTSSALTRASARSRILCLICPRLLGCISLEPPTDTSFRCSTAPSHRQSGTSHPTRLAPDPSAPVQTDSKCIAFHVGGFLQVAVSEAPLQDHAAAHCRARGAPDTALRLLANNPLPNGLPYSPNPKIEPRTARGTVHKSKSDQPKPQPDTEFKESVETEKTVSDVPVSEERVPAKIRTNVAANRRTWP